MFDPLRLVLGSDDHKTFEEVLAAQKELDTLRERAQELELLISNGRALLEGKTSHLPWPPAPEPQRPPTLHAVIRDVLLEHGNQWLTTTYVAREIASRRLYRRRDGLPPSVCDVSARVSTYSDWFVRLAWYFRLWDAPLGFPSGHRFGPRL